MIANATLELLRRPELLARVKSGDPALLDAVIDESLRREPAAAVIDRYATADVTLGGAAIARGDLVRISIAAANRDPAVFERPDAFDPAAPTCAGIWRSPRGRMSASGCTWRASRRALRCRPCSPGCRACAPTRSNRQRSAAGVPQAGRAARALARLKRTRLRARLTVLCPRCRPRSAASGAR